MVNMKESDDRNLLIGKPSPLLTFCQAPHLKLEEVGGPLPNTHPITNQNPSHHAEIHHRPHRVAGQQNQLHAF